MSEVAAFKENLALALASKSEQALSAGYTRVRLWAQDEARIGLLPIVRHRITAKGVQPVRRSEQKREYFYLFGAIEPETGEDFMLEMPTLETATFQVFLDEFAKLDPESFHLLLVDNATAHTTDKLKVPKNIELLFLPPCSPELNPIERFWRELKDWLSDYEPQVLKELRELLTLGLNSFTKASISSVTSFEYLMSAWKSAIA